MYTWHQTINHIRQDSSYSQLVLDAYYDDPLIDAATRYQSSDEWSSIEKLIPSSGLALDVGAGRGIASFALAKRGLSVTALEPDRSNLVGTGAIASLNSHLDNPITIVSDRSELISHLHDNQFDLVFLRAALHHCPDLVASCSEFYRVLKPGGTLLCVREHVLSRKSHLAAFLATHPLHHFYGGENAYLLDEYTTAIKYSGFNLVKTLSPLESPINYYPASKIQIQAKVASAISFKIPFLQDFVSYLLSYKVCWHFFVKCFVLVDHRPGRLYSFLALKPH